MRFRDSDLRGVPVVTRSGQKVGKLAAIIVDSDRHEVAQYAVARSLLLAKIVPDELLVHPSQVVSLDGERMVVEDGAVAERAAAEMARGSAEAASNGASTMRG